VLLKVALTVILRPVGCSEGPYIMVTNTHLKASKDAAGEAVSRSSFT